MQKNKNKVQSIDQSMCVARFGSVSVVLVKIVLFELIRNACDRSSPPGLALPVMAVEEDKMLGDKARVLVE